MQVKRTWRLRVATVRKKRGSEAAKPRKIFIRLLCSRSFVSASNSCRNASSCLGSRVPSQKWEILRSHNLLQPSSSPGPACTNVSDRKYRLLAMWINARRSGSEWELGRSIILRGVVEASLMPINRKERRRRRSRRKRGDGRSATNGAINKNR